MISTLHAENDGSGVAFELWIIGDPSKPRVGSSPTRRTTRPPVWGVATRGLVLDQARDQLEVLRPPAATGPAELPQFASSSVVLVDSLVDAVHLDLASAALVDHGGDAVDEFGEAGLVVGGDPVARWLMFALGTHADDTSDRRCAYGR
jgi:hypothetical protein